MSKRTKLLLKENNAFENQIQNEDNRAALTDIVVYIRSANISPYDQERVRRDIGEMIVDGEKRGKTAKEIIGDDSRLVCDRVIAEVPRLSGKEYILSLLRDVLLSVDVLLVIWFLSNLLAWMLGSTSPYFTVTAGNVLCAVLTLTIAFGTVHAISKNAFPVETGHSSKRGLLAVLLLFVLLLACMCVNVFLRQTLFHLHPLLAAAGIAALLLLYKMLDWKID